MRYQKGKLTVYVDLSAILAAVEKTKGYGVEDDEAVEVEMISFSEAMVTFPITCEVDEHFYPGVRTLSNGDPGYPDEYDIEPKGDYKELEKNLVNTGASTSWSTDWDDEEVYGEYPEEWE